MDAWSLPTRAEIGGREYAINADFRDVLDILERLDDVEQPEFVRWTVALALFYEDFESMPAADHQEAMEYLSRFICCGRQEDGKSTAKMLDWQQDALAIVADVNKVAGCEVRALPFLHWWSFMAFFNGIGEGQLSTLVSIRDKLRRGKKLEKWEQEYYRENKERVVLKRRCTAEELEENARYEALLRGE